MNVTVGSLLFVIAVVIFCLAAFGVAFSGVTLVPLGLAFFAAGHIVP